MQKQLTFGEAIQIYGFKEAARLLGLAVERKPQPPDPPSRGSAA